MIVLFTDFGWHGPYVGQMKAVLAQQAPDQTVIDLMHDAPLFKPRAAAYLLASLVEPFPNDTVFLAVVDPGVGSGERRPGVLKADGRWYVGPDNGLFNIIAKQSADYTAWVIDWLPALLSDSFHGRDLFAPVAAQLACGQLPEMTETSLVQNPEEWPADLAEIIYLDSFGNAMTGLHGARISKDAALMINGAQINYARVFAEAEKGKPFWYVNSNGLVEIAMNQADAARTLGLDIGMQLQVL
ncbi:MAG: SAM-dependent chlorinase/fluorinase [Halobacteria archaeon]|nr:SAM-dependent chlorinase/fluorinase [Halobacteria archaeon]